MCRQQGEYHKQQIDVCNLLVCKLCRQRCTLRIELTGKEINKTFFFFLSAFVVNKDNNSFERFCHVVIFSERFVMFLIAVLNKQLF